MQCPGKSGQRFDLGVGRDRDRESDRQYGVYSPRSGHDLARRHDQRRHAGPVDRHDRRRGHAYVTITDGPVLSDLTVTSGIIDGSTAATGNTGNTVAGGINRAGTGRLVLSGNNTYTGPTIIDNATGAEMDAQNSQALGASVANAMNSFSVTGPTSGTYSLSSGGQTAGGFTLLFSASAIQNGLNALTSITTLGGSVTVNLISTTVAGANVTNTYDVVFGGNFTGATEGAVTTANGTGVTSATSWSRRAAITSTFKP